MKQTNVKDITTTAEWKNLRDLAKHVSTLHLRQMLSHEDAERNKHLRLSAPNWHIDLTRQRITTDALLVLYQLANKRDILHEIDQMFQGKIINISENRPALYTALRAPANSNVLVNNHNVITDVQNVYNKMKTFTENVHSGAFRGYTNKRFTHVVSIGIGGSNLGPEMTYHALDPFKKKDMSVRFVSNVDPYDLYKNLRDLNPEQTLIIIASKSFTTSETIHNAKEARRWIVSHLGKHAVEKHCVAVSANTKQVTAFGIDPKNMFEFWGWVGGRYSVSSAIGLQVMLGIGAENFKLLLQGFHEMDEHYRNTPIETNVPIVMALINIWNTNMLDFRTHGIISYDERLSLFGLHLQQLIMESLGKNVTQDGKPLDVTPCPIFYSGTGTDAQHSFFQLLHQGKNIVSPIDFVASVLPAKETLTNRHITLLLNMIAQADVMANGVTKDELIKQGVDKKLVPHKILPGNKPSTLIYTEKLTPKSLGSLIALYEHMTHAWGVMFNINPFDQMGVEAGKKLTIAYEKKFPKTLTLKSFESFIQQ